MQQLLIKLRHNWRSGLTVALISGPLSVSLAVASHTSPSVGILTAIWAGLVASLFGGSNYNVIGPTGALSGILAAYAIVHGADTLAVLAILAGLLILAARVLRLDRYLVLVPGAAIHGFTLGVACIIGLSQAEFALGLSGLDKHERFIDNLFEVTQHPGAISPAAVSVFAVALLLLFSARRLFPRLPGALVVAPLGIVLGYLAEAGHLPVRLATLGTLYPSISTKLFLPYQLHFDVSMIMPVVAIALVGIIETMVSAKIADSMTHTKYDQPREMLALGLANLASGLMGGMPATAALARTSLNIRSGATDKLSATLSSLFVAVFALLLLHYFSYIPLTVIAAILVFVAYQMVEAEHFERMWRHDRISFYVSLLVAGITLVGDPILGILCGVSLALLILIEKLTRGQFDLIINDENKQMVHRITDEKLQEVQQGSGTIVYSIAGLLCYVNCDAHLDRFRTKLNGSTNIILRLRSVYYIDLAGVDAIDEIIRTVQEQGKVIFVTSINPMIARQLSRSPALQALEAEGKVFSKSTAALRQLGFNL